MKKIILISVLLLALSCTGTETALSYANQEESIDKFLSSNFGDSLIVRNQGSNRAILVNADENSNTLQVGDSLYMFYAGYVFSNGPGTLFDTNNPAISKEYSDTLVQPILYGESEMIPGLENGLLGVRQGEESYILFSAKYGYKNKRMYNVPSLSPIIFHVWIEKIKKNQ